MKMEVVLQVIHIQIMEKLLSIAQKISTMKICYTSEVYDELTGLYYLNARYYNPENYSFITTG